MTRDYRLYLDDILEAINKIENYTKDLNVDLLMKDDKTFDAVIKNLMIIGEAAKNIPENIRENYNDIPWKEMAGMRDKLIHEYFGIRYDVIWKTITLRLPQIKPLIKVILKQLDKNIGNK